MGITVVSSTPAAGLSSGLPVAADAAAGGEGIATVDFAALLVQQMLGGTATPPTPASPINEIATALNPGATIAGATKSAAGEHRQDDKDAVASNLLLPSDLAAALAIPPTPPILPAAPQATAQLPPKDEAPILPTGLAASGETRNTPLPGTPLTLPPIGAPKDAPGASIAALATRPQESANIAAPTDLPAATTTPFADALAAHAAAAPVRQAEQLPTPPAVETPIGDRGWSRDFSDSVVWMSRQEVHSAQLNLNPPHLGPVQVTLSVNGDQVTAAFASPHSEVRQAIQDALPQLREMLSGAGINLGQANIGAQLQQQQQPPTPQASDNGRFASDNAILQGATGEAASVPTLVSRGRGLVDLFA